MGADRRMYPPPWASLPGFVAHDWMACTGERNLSEVAESFCAARGIQDGDTLVGASLGGMVACEITKIRKISVLWLVGSATHKEEVNGLLAALHPLAQVAPIDWLRFSAGKLPLELSQMFSTVDASFIRSMIPAIFAWNGLGATDTKVYRLHGRHDRVIPPPRNTDLLLDGGHLICRSHAPECVAFIRAGFPPQNEPSR